MNFPALDEKKPTIEGCGIGLRMQHYHAISSEKPSIPWMEILTDNYLIEESQARQFIREIRNDYPITCHGVGLSLGSVDPFNEDYLKKLKQLVGEINPAWISDHLCWTSVHGLVTHDLIPLPYTEETIAHVVDRICRVQDYLQQPLVIENVSSYLQFCDSEMTEWEFLSEVVTRSDAKILLDVNNIYVSAYNHGFDPLDYLNGVPLERVQEMHLAGYEDKGTHLLDTHGQAVTQPVWDLFAKFSCALPQVPVLIEWDNHIPALSELLAEANKAHVIRQEHSK